MPRRSAAPNRPSAAGRLENCRWIPLARPAPLNLPKSRIFQCPYAAADPLRCAEIPPSRRRTRSVRTPVGPISGGSFNATRRWIAVTLVAGAVWIGAGRLRRGGSARTPPPRTTSPRRNSARAGRGHDAAAPAAGEVSLAIGEQIVPVETACSCHGTSGKGDAAPGGAAIDPEARSRTDHACRARATDGHELYEVIWRNGKGADACDRGKARHKLNGSHDSFGDREGPHARFAGQGRELVVRRRQS